MPCIFLLTRSLDILIDTEYIKEFCLLYFSEEYYFTAALSSEPYGDYIFCSSSNTGGGAPDPGEGPSAPSPGNNPSSPGEGPSDPNRNNNSSNSTGGTSDSNNNSTHPFIYVDPSLNYSPSSDVSIGPGDEAYSMEEQTRHHYDHLRRYEPIVRQTENDLSRQRPVDSRNLSIYTECTSDRRPGESLDNYYSRMRALHEY